MDDNRPLTLLGISSIKIKMHDGLFRRFTKVIYDPNMSKNPISLSILDIGGCKLVGGNIFLKVVWDSPVVTKDYQVVRLYVLEGSTIKGPVIMSSSTLVSGVTR